ncbi:MAG TPA: hypothetical protein VML94_05435 [Thermoplasmata archaeon]|nr:hypothetical protein [Thermoplasmata archaeon]
MRRWRGSSRGLAEIVGTLMLVVIVVAAATAFSFFVAAYQKQVQDEEALTHDRALESVKIVGIEASPCQVGFNNTCHSLGCDSCIANLSFTVVSLDVNAMGFTNLFLNHLPVVNYTATVRGSIQSPCFNATSRNNTTWGLFPCSTLVVPGSSTVTLHFNLGGCLTPHCGSNAYWALGPGEGPGNIPSSNQFSLQFVTARGNQFAETFSPPVAVISVFYVSGGLTSIPVFDGLNSYQPKSADNSSVVQYAWHVTDSNGMNITDPNCGNNGVGTGGEFECANLTGSYDVQLMVTNSDGLTGMTSIPFTT